jgi:hypothetical protein
MKMSGQLHRALTRSKRGHFFTQFDLTLTWGVLDTGNHSTFHT